MLGALDDKIAANTEVAETARNRSHGGPAPMKRFGAEAIAGSRRSLSSPWAAAELNNASRIDVWSTRIDITAALGRYVVRAIQTGMGYH